MTRAHESGPTDQKKVDGQACRLEIGVAEVMVTDPHCGLCLPELAGLTTRFGPDRLVERFCSTACALAWSRCSAAQRYCGVRMAERQRMADGNTK